jgi:DNA repair exonuclease SbcCD ATPase subunit
MKPNTPLSLARRALASAPADDAEEQRVLELFRNRTELKKAYTSLKDELYELQERLKKHEALTARAEQQFEQLGQRLAVPQTAYPTMVFYQLRGLWAAGGKLLGAYGSDLREEHIGRERRAHVAEINRRQFGQRQGAETALREAQARMAEAAQTVSRLEGEIKDLNRPWHIIRRRDATAELVEVRGRQALAARALESAQAGFDAVLAVSETPFPGLSVEARRSVNLALIAYAEVLSSRLEGGTLLRLAGEAASRSEPPAASESRVECEAVMAQVAAAMRSLESAGSAAMEIRRRVEELVKAARYLAAEDTVPTPESVCPAARELDHRNGPRVGRGGIPNVLGAGTWGIFRILLP